MEKPMRDPVVSGPTTGGMEDITGSKDAELAEVNDFAIWELNEGKRKGGHPSLDFVLVRAQVQVVAGLMYTLHYKGNDDQGVCQEEHTMVIYSKPWEGSRVVKSDTKTGCT
eukprot:jgi/Undpi1/11009/HiC_scaffold_30.g13309.m1